jgi:hypothetical protein
MMLHEYRPCYNHCRPAVLPHLANHPSKVPNSFTNTTFERIATEPPIGSNAAVFSSLVNAAVLSSFVNGVFEHAAFIQNILNPVANDTSNHHPTKPSVLPDSGTQSPAANNAAERATAATGIPSKAIEFITIHPTTSVPNILNPVIYNISHRCTTRASVHPDTGTSSLVAGTFVECTTTDALILFNTNILSSFVNNIVRHIAAEALGHPNSSIPNTLSLLVHSTPPPVSTPHLLLLMLSLLSLAVDYFELPLYLL